MSTLTINDDRVVSASITTPYYGAWTADMLTSGAAPSTSVSIVVNDLKLSGTVVRSGTFAGSASARVVGGGGGWRREIPARGYSHLAGVKLSTVLADAARESGERIAIAIDRTIGTHYARERASAERVLRLLLDGRWWMSPDGETRFDDRDASPIVTPFTVVNRHPDRGAFEIATEIFAPWQPGRTFTAPTVPDVQAISSVTIEADNEGKLRLHVLTVDSTTKERLRTDLRSIVRAESPTLSYAGVYEYTVAPKLPIDPGILTTIDATPSDDRMPPLTGIPLFGIGIVAPPLVGTKCRIRFVNADPSRPECFALEGTTEHLVTVEALSVILHNLVFAMGAASLPSAWIASGVSLGLVNAALLATSAPAPPGFIAQGIASGTQATAMLTGPGSTSAPFTATIATAIGGKTLDVSGLFPGIGVPNG